MSITDTINASVKALVDDVRGLPKSFRKIDVADLRSRSQGLAKSAVGQATDACVGLTRQGVKLVSTAKGLANGGVVRRTATDVRAEEPADDADRAEGPAADVTVTVAEAATTAPTTAASTEAAPTTPPAAPKPVARAASTKTAATKAAAKRAVRKPVVEPVAEQAPVSGTAAERDTDNA